MLQIYKKKGIENIMALRGDIPDTGRTCFDFEHASDLVRAIREESEDFCIGGACYPEGHVECESPSEDIRNLKTKIDAGCQFLVTQMRSEAQFFFRATIPQIPGKEAKDSDMIPLR